jgi:hypothetical protein
LRLGHNLGQVVRARILSHLARHRPQLVLRRTGKLASCATGPRRRPNCSTHKPCPPGPASCQMHQTGRQAPVCPDFPIGG